MTISTIPVVVKGTGFQNRAGIIRWHCKEGRPVQIRPNYTNCSPGEALEVWLQCDRLFGLHKSWKKIGYVEGGRYGALARLIDDGNLRVRKSVINSFFAPLDREQPQVALALEVEWTPDRAPADSGGLHRLMRQR